MFSFMLATYSIFLYRVILSIIFLIHFLDRQMDRASTYLKQLERKPGIPEPRTQVSHGWQGPRHLSQSLCFSRKLELGGRVGS